MIKPNDSINFFSELNFNGLIPALYYIYDNVFIFYHVN